MPRAPGRRRILAAVAAVHLALACVWITTSPVAPQSQGRAVFMELIALPAVKTPTPAVVTPPVLPRPRQRAKVQAPAPVQAVAAPAVAAVADNDPLAAPVVPADPLAPDADAITTQAKKDVVVWDRATNKDRLRGITNFDDRPLAVAIRGAFKPRHTTMTNYMTSDGRAITKVTSPSGTYCLVRLNENSIMSETLRRQGSDTRKVACP
jgi:hypothetical protein